MLKRRSKKQKYIYQPSLGVKNDFERLLQRFTSEGTVRYEKFAECWRELNMASYCAGRQTQMECREFVEECFLIASQFWLPPSSFLVRAGALYLLYGLYNFQLVVPKVKIRITPEQWTTVLEFQQEAREQKHLDLDYVFQKMLFEKGFMFVATADECYSSQKNLGEAKVIPDSMKEESNLIDEIFTTPALNQLSMVHDQYQKMKSALTDEDGQPDSSLSIIHTDLITGIYRTLRTHRERSSLQQMKSQTDKLAEGIDDTTFMDVSDEAVSIKKQLKKKAFEFGAEGYGKRTRKSKSDTEQNNYSGDNKQIGTVTVGLLPVRKAVRPNLFDKDEEEDTPVELSQVHEIYCMPDLNVITKSSQKSANTSDVDTCFDDETTQNIKVVEKDNVKSEQLDVHKNTHKTEIKTNASSSERESSQQSGAEVQSSCKTNKKKQAGEKITSAAIIVEEQIDSKQPTAQQKLQIKLNKRKKEARLKSKDFKKR